MRLIRRHLTFANVASGIALFVAITGGTAVALNGGNTVFTDDIANDTQPAGGGNPAGGLVAADLRPSSVGSSEVANNSLAGADVNESTLALSGQLGGYFEAESDSGSQCNDDSEDGDVCASTGITLARPGQLLLNASGEWSTFSLNDTNGPSSGTDDTGRVVGVCALRVDGMVIGPMDGSSIGERSEGGTVANHPFEAPGTVALTALSDVLPAGSHTADVLCSEVDGDIDWANISLTAARVDN